MVPECADVIFGGGRSVSCSPFWYRCRMHGYLRRGVVDKLYAQDNAGAAQSEMQSLQRGSTIRTFWLGLRSVNVGMFHAVYSLPRAGTGA